jgi:hypothetical protein
MPRPVNYGKYASFTRGDLIRTIEVLLERETKLLNQIAQLQNPTVPWGRRDDGEKQSS